MDNGPERADQRLEDGVRWLADGGSGDVGSGESGGDAMILIAITISIAVFQLYDWWSTRTILAMGGDELNPVARKGIELLGVDGYLGAKAVAVTALGYFAGQQNIWFAVAVLATYVAATVYNSRSV